MLKKRVGKKRAWVSQEAVVASPAERLGTAHKNALKSMQHGANIHPQHQLQHQPLNKQGDEACVHTTPCRYRWCSEEACLYTSVVPIADTAVAELAHLVAHHPSKYHAGPHPLHHLSEEIGSAGVERANLLVGAAWREERRDPAVAICLAAEAVEVAEMAVCLLVQCQNREPPHTAAAAAAEAQHVVRRSCFIFGKILVEAFADFDRGATLLEHALAANVSTPAPVSLPAAEQRRREGEEVGIAFHLTRALYDNYRYADAWAVLVRWTRPLFPHAWADVSLPAPHHQQHLIEQTGGSPTTSSSADRTATASKYHRAMLLHGCVLAAVFRPGAARAVSHCIASWIDEHKEVMWRQFNAEIRFATVIQRLLPMVPMVPVGETSSRGGAALAGADDPIYALGESHTLPLVWQTLDLAGTLGSRQVLPRLVIGLKAWHFNPELAQCRERGILLSHAASIPPRSTIVVCAGEIDLREAGVIAMLPHHWGEHRPKKYASSSIAIAATIDAFFGGLRELRDSGNHRKLLLHPVRPPPRGYHAAECHELTVQWNDAVAAACADPANSRISQLDFFDSLIDNDEQHAADQGAQPPAPALRPDFHIGDGFHLNRQYLPLVAASISRSLTQEGTNESILF